MSLSLAFIPLLPKAQLSSSAIRADLVANWPQLPKPEPVKGETDQISFRIGSSDVIIAFMRAPIPWTDLDGPCQTAFLWPDAEPVLRSHVGHLIITLLSKEGPVAQAGLLTQVCAAIVGSCPQAPGVFWSNATQLIRGDIFRDFAVKFLPDAPPLYLWVDFRVGPSGNGKSSGFTTGLTALGHMEFETESSSESPGELKERLFGLANYVVENGPVIRNGDTIGEDANERIRVVYAKSAFGHEGQVMRLEYDAPPKKKGWFGW
ncbi:DUF4261 domain-containing protein [Anatilimnocola floriformis]|uniref:DUF4261 domain-containing protein n=1 Tax=Anatilimnocola floriformis TaxID=2948575 RepID=UPI0020C55EDB|nr:DUF4261 domain-containing protein [Anatilimnocola floriformis]